MQSGGGGGMTGETAVADGGASDMATPPIVGGEANAASPASPPPNPLARIKTYAFAAAEVQAEVDAKLIQIGKGARVKGFRPGHVPLRTARQRWGGQCLRETLAEKAHERFAEEAAAMEEQPATAPRYAPAAVAEGGGLYQVECHYEAMPAIAEPDFSAQEIRRPTLEVGEKEVDEMIQKLRRDSGRYLETDREARSDDRLLVDFEAYRGDELLESGKDRQWILDSPLLHGEVSKQLQGARAGDVRTAMIKQPDDHPEESLRGAEVRTEIKVKSVSELQLPPLNQEFFAQFNLGGGADSDSNSDSDSKTEQEGLAAFREEVRGRLQSEVERRLRRSMHLQAMGALLKATPPFDLPREMVQMEAAGMYQKLQEEAKAHGLPGVSAEAVPRVYSEAARRVALGLIIGRWREREKPEIADAEMDAQLDSIAADYEDAAAFKARMKQDERAMGALRLSLLEEKAAKWAQSQTKIVDEPLTLTQLLSGNNEQL